MLSRLDTMPACHGQTDRIAISISHVSVLTRDKNEHGCTEKHPNPFTKLHHLIAFPLAQLVALQSVSWHYLHELHSSSRHYYSVPYHVSACVHCYKGNTSSQWRMANFNHVVAPKPLNQLNWNLAWLIMPRDPRIQKSKGVGRWVGEVVASRAFFPF